MKDHKLTILFLGSAESIHMLKWAKFFSAKGHKVHLISYASSINNYDFGEIEMHFINKIFPIQTWPFNTIINLPITIMRIRKLLRTIRPDIIHAHYVFDYGSLASWLNFHPLIITAWGSDILINPNKSIYSKLVVKYILKKSDLITCDAGHMKEAIIKLGVKEPEIEIVNFGVDTKKFSPGLENEKLKKELGILGYGTVISLRSLEPIYDIESLIKAIPLVIEEFPKIKFLIISEGSQDKELKKKAENLGVKENINFLGRIPNEELPKYLRLANVYISTSLSDGGIAASTAEAMACGLPVIITDVGDNKKWVKDGRNGFLIPVKSPKILAEKIIYLLKNKNIRERFGEINRKIIEEENNYYKEMAKMENIYYELI